MRTPRRRYKADHAFATIAAANELIAQGGAEAMDGRRIKKKHSETWVRRGGTNVQGVYKDVNTKPSVGFIIRGEA